MKKLMRSIRHEWPLHFSLLATSWLPDNVIFYRMRGWAAHGFFGSCGLNLRVGRGLFIHNPANVRLGSSVFMAYGCCLFANAEICIEDEVLLGPYCVMASGNHTRLNGSFRYGKAMAAPIRVGRGCWIGAHVTITGGVTIGPGSLVAAGAVVSRDVPAGVMAAGVPARVVKNLDEQELQELAAERVLK
jgi:maltose O-acetyltransferase